MAKAVFNGASATLKRHLALFKLSKQSDQSHQNLNSDL